jgi:hypothetical protein
MAVLFTLAIVGSNAAGRGKRGVSRD